MKLKLLIILMALLPILSFAQKNELMLGLSVGMGVPLGDFAESDIIINEEGLAETNGHFAKNGIAFDFSADYRLGYYFGFAGRIIGGSHRMNLTGINDYLDQQLSGTDNRIVITSKGWGDVGIYAGAYFAIPINKIHIDARLMAGYINLFSPEYNYLIYQGDDLTNVYIQEKYNSGSFSYDFGLGVKYKFASNKFLLLNGDYIAADVNKENIETIDPITQEPTNVNMNIQYQNLTFTIGIGYIF